MQGEPAQHMWGVGEMRGEKNEEGGNCQLLFRELYIHIGPDLVNTGNPTPLLPHC